MKSLLKHITNLILPVTGILFFFMIWQIIVMVFLTKVDETNFQGFLPYHALGALYQLVQTQYFWISVFVSLKRIILGLFFAALIGIPFGLFLGMSAPLREMTNIPMQFLRMISPISWMPIALFFLPGFEEAILFLITMASVWPIILSTSQGVQQVKNEWINMARNQGAISFQLVFRIIFPASIPFILSGIRLAMGVAWIVLVPAELLGTSSGLGYLINDARDSIAYDKLMGIVVAIGIIGYGLDAFFQIIRKKFDWQLQ
ncbi:MAG: ABC transporter permease [Spirochaetes bacterium]|nr:ABC transporter permease [Spirochaetota bacterium]